VQVIPLWAEPELTPRPRDDEWRAGHGIAERDLLVLVAGNMGVMHDLDPVLAAAHALRAEPVVVVLAGAGVRRSHWERRAHDLGVTDSLRFLPFQQDGDYARMVSAADVALVPFAEGMEALAVPSRAFSFLAAGRAVIALMSPASDVARLVTDNRAGWTVRDRDDLTRLLRALTKDPDAVTSAGQNARALYERSHTKEFVTGRYVELLRDISRERAR
jgi:glycosyltransferase involved in cell wall biosynthesis